MRYHFKKPINYSRSFGELYLCNHPIYTRCTLYKIEERGLCVIQQAYNKKNKSTYWKEIDACLIDCIYTNPNFYLYFDKYAKECKDGLFPTFTIRQIMHALKMKPLPKEPWETYFDRSPL